MGPVGGYNDPYFQQLIGGAIGSAWGQNPATGGVMPGPVSTLAGYLQGDFNRGGQGATGTVFPNPTFVQGPGNGFTVGGGAPAAPSFPGAQNFIPPLLNGGQFGNIPGGFNWNFQGVPGQVPVGVPFGVNATA